MDSEADEAVAEFLDREKQALGDVLDIGAEAEEEDVDGGDHVGAETVEVEAEEAANSELDDEDCSKQRRGATSPRASINLQRMASVEEINRAIAKAEQSRPRRRRLESETMQNWRKEFEESLKRKDEQEAEAIAKLRENADQEKTEWYANWKQEIAERREQHRRDMEEALDQVDENPWTRMSRLAQDLSTRRNSRDLNRLKPLLNALEKPPKRVPVVYSKRRLSEAANEVASRP